MLTLTRKLFRKNYKSDEKSSLRIGPVRLTVHAFVSDQEQDSAQCRVSISAPKGIPIVREELVSENSDFDIEITNCARCGYDHKVTTYRFTQPPSTGHKFFAICPETFEPILVAVTGDVE